MVREMHDTDGIRVIEIYQMGIETRNATFETTAPCWSDWDFKHHKHSRFIYEKHGIVVGWVALSPVSLRKVYSGAAEVSIYIDLNFSKQGIGSKLMEKVIESSEDNGIWTLQSSVFPENVATLRLHEKFGFRVLGYRERVAMLDDLWRNTLLLERRSKLIGF